jgi:hypothetical protein
LNPRCRYRCRPDDRAIGSINCYAHDRAAFGHHEIQLGMTFAKPAAVSLEKVRLQRVAQGRADATRATDGGVRLVAKF